MLLSARKQEIVLKLQGLAGKKNNHERSFPVLEVKMTVHASKVKRLLHGCRGLCVIGLCLCVSLSLTSSLLHLLQSLLSMYRDSATNSSLTSLWETIPLISPFRSKTLSRLLSSQTIRECSLKGIL